MWTFLKIDAALIVFIFQLTVLTYEIYIIYNSLKELITDLLLVPYLRLHISSNPPLHKSLLEKLNEMMSPLSDKTHL
jgi:hypothetical protein